MRNKKLIETLLLFFKGLKYAILGYIFAWIIVLILMMIIKYYNG